MFDHIRDYILKFTREKIDSVTGEDNSAWSIGTTSSTEVVENKEKGFYSWPCLAHETAMVLVNEYLAKGMKKGKCDKDGTSVYLERNSK